MIEFTENGKKYLKTEGKLCTDDIELNINVPMNDTDAVHYIADSGKTDTQKQQARTNIGAGTYSKPDSGIPSTDLTSAVQTKLNDVGGVTRASNPLPITTISDYCVNIVGASGGAFKNSDDNKSLVISPTGGITVSNTTSSSVATPNAANINISSTNGNIALSGAHVTVPTPTSDSDASTKLYADTEIAKKSKVTGSTTAVSGASNLKSINIDGTNYNIPEGGSSSSFSVLLTYNWIGDNPVISCNKTPYEIYTEFQTNKNIPVNIDYFITEGEHQQELGMINSASLEEGVYKINIKWIFTTYLAALGSTYRIIQGTQIGQSGTVAWTVDTSADSACSLPVTFTFNEPTTEGQSGKVPAQCDTSWTNIYYALEFYKIPVIPKHNGFIGIPSCCSGSTISFIIPAQLPTSWYYVEWYNGASQQWCEAYKFSTSGGSTPSNMVTTDTDQEITGVKTFTNGVNISTIETNSGLTITTDSNEGFTLNNTYNDFSADISVDPVNQRLGLYADETDRSCSIVMDTLYSQTSSINMSANDINMDGAFHMPYVTTAPTKDNSSGVRMAILSSEPDTKYDGWLYFIEE